MSAKTTRFEHLLEAVPDALVGMDQGGVIRFVNRQTESLFGYDRDQLIGKPVETLVPDPLWQVYAEHREGYFADPRTRSSALELELMGRYRNGTDFPINLSMSHIDTGDVLLVITAVREVDKQKRAVKSAQITAAIVESSNDAIIGTGLDGIITMWNPAAQRIYGYANNEVIGRSSSILVPKDRAGEMEARLARIRNGQAVEPLETTLVRRDGTPVPVSINTAPVHDEDGNIVGVSEVHRDVSAQRQAFEAVQRMAAIVEYSDDAIISSTLDGIITSWNAAAERLFGYSGKEVIGTSVETISAHARPEEMTTILAKVRGGEHIEHLETIRVRKDGTVFPVSLTVSPIRDADCKIIGTSMISRDMTEMKHAARYARSLIEAALDPLVTISPEGKINDVNTATVKATGVPRAKLIGTDFSHYFTDPGKAHDGYRQAFAQGSVTDYPLTLRHRDGTLTEVLYNASVYRDFNDKAVGVFAAARDVTGQRRAFEATQRLARIVESSADAIMGMTLAGIVTDWNPAAERLYGYSREEIIGRSADLIIPEDRREESRVVLAKIRAGEHVNQLETLRVRKDGSLVEVTLTLSPITDADGTVVGTSVITRDESDSKHAARYARSLLEAALDPLVTISPEGKINDVNAATVKATGVPREDLIGTDFSEYFTDPVKAHNGYQQVFRRGAVTDFPLSMRHRDGSLTEVLYNASVYRDFNGNVLGVFAAARDVTAQRKSLETAQRMAAIVENSAEALLSLALDGTILTWNPAAERMSGYSREEVVGQTCEFIDPPDRASEMEPVLAQVSAGIPVKDFKTERVRKDGSTFPISLAISPIPDENGEIIGASLIARDLTLERQASETAQRMAAIIEHSEDAILSRTIDGVILSWNPAAERMFGYTSEEILGKNVDALIPPDRAGEKISILATISAGHALSNFETVRRHKDGREVTVSLTISPIRDEDGVVSAASVIFRDVTELKHAARYSRSLIEANLDPMATIGPDGKINDVNEATVRITGVPREQLIGSDCVGYFTDVDRAQEGLQRVFDQGVVTDFPLTVRHRDGTLTDVLGNGSLYHDEGGNVLGILAVARDVTRQKESYDARDVSDQTQALAAAEKVAAIVEYSAEAIFSCTLDEIITTWNPAAEDLYGYSRQEITGKSGSLLTPKGRPDEIRSILSLVKDGEIVADYASLSVRKGGTVFPVSLTIAPIRNADDTVIGASAIARELTRQQ